MPQNKFAFLPLFSERKANIIKEIPENIYSGIPRRTPL
jgi:hypothetical protein